MKKIIFLGIFLLFISFFPSVLSFWEKEVVVNATLAELGYSIEISERLAEGIFFTNLTGSLINVQYPLMPGSKKNNATWNYDLNEPYRRSGYQIFVHGKIRIDICHGAETNLCSTPNCSGEGNVEINITNMVWSSSLIGNENNPSLTDYKHMTIGYDNYNKVAVGVKEGDIVYLRYWLDVPPATPGGNYTTIYKIQAVPSGGKCG